MASFRDRLSRFANQPGFCHLRIAKKPERQRKIQAVFLYQLAQAKFIHKRTANNSQPFIADSPGTWAGKFDYDFSYLAKAVRRILEKNKSLARNHKIRVISISIGWSSDMKGYADMVAAVNEAKKGEDICSEHEHPGYLWLEFDGDRPERTRRSQCFWILYNSNFVEGKLF